MSKKHECSKAFNQGSPEQDTAAQRALEEEKIQFLLQQFEIANSDLLQGSYREMI